MQLPHGSIRILTQLAAALPFSSSAAGPPLRGLCLLCTAPTPISSPSSSSSSSLSRCPSAPFPSWGSLRNLCTASAPPLAPPAGSAEAASVSDAAYDVPSGGASSSSSLAAVSAGVTAAAAAVDPPFRWAVDRRAALEGRLPDNLPAPLDHSVKQVRYSTVHRFSKVPLADANFVF